MRKKIMIFASAALLCGCAGNIDVSYVDNTEINVVSSEVADETSSVGEIVNPDGYFWKESYALKGNDDKEYGRYGYKRAGILIVCYTRRV